jgi:hypothetical protein
MRTLHDDLQLLMAHIPPGVRAGYGKVVSPAPHLTVPGFHEAVARIKTALLLTGCVELHPEAGSAAAHPPAALLTYLVAASSGEIVLVLEHGVLTRVNYPIACRLLGFTVERDELGGLVVRKEEPC